MQIEIADRAYAAVRRHVKIGGIVPSTIHDLLRAGEYTDVIAFIEFADQHSDFVTRRPPVRQPRPSRCRVKAMSRDRRFGRRQDRRRGERQWRDEWSFVLVA
jgi:hypothetical protein